MVNSLPLREMHMHASQGRLKIPSFDLLRMVSEAEPLKAGVRGNDKNSKFKAKS